MLRKLITFVRGCFALWRAGMCRGRHPFVAIRAMREVKFWGPGAAGLRLSASLFPTRTALIDDFGPLTYRQVDRQSNALGRALYEHGVRYDTTVGVLCRDHRFLVETIMACGKLGVDVVLLNTGFAAGQLTEAVHRESIGLLIHDDEFSRALHEVPQAVPRMLAWSKRAFGSVPRLSELINAHSGGELPRPSRNGSVILLTSGTTGTPQGAEREVRSALSAHQFLDRIPLRSDECTFIAAPMFHAVGYSQLLLAFMLSATVVVHRQFHASELVRSVHSFQCTTVVLVPTMLQRIVELDAEFVAKSMESVRIVLSSGSALLPALYHRAHNILGDVIYNLYGSTEAAVTAVARPEDLRAAPDSVGRCPYPCSVALFDENGQQVKAAHVTGRIFAGSDLGFAGYTGLDHRQRAGKLISTGDLGHFDEQGRLYVDGREDDMIVSGGENVFPGEVENFIATHYQVKDVAVVGVPDREFGQRLRAYVVPQLGATLSAEDLRNFVRMSLARHKVPREVVLVNAVPRNATGKVMRRSLTGY